MQYFAALPLVASLVAAQGDMKIMSLAPAAAAGPMTHTVVVGGLKPVETGMAPFLGYTPESITANLGDTVSFVFMQKNHTATQSTFAEPCKKMEGGADSGFMPNPDGKAGVAWDFKVESTEALWFYCKQQNGIHCGKGMVFSINAATSGDKTMAAFKQLAVNKNGTGLLPGALQSVDPAAQAIATTVTIVAGGGAVATPPAGGAAGAVASGTVAGGAALATATVVAGAGQDGQGQACSCSCLCGVNSFPAAAAVGNFGGFAGLMGSA